MCITLHSAFFSCISDPVHILRCTYTTHVYSFKCIAALLHYTAFVFFAAFIRITSTAHSVLAYPLHSIAYGRITTTDAYYTHSISTHSKRIYDTVHSSLTAYNICCIRLHSLLTAYNTCCIQTHCSLHAFVGDRIHTHTESYTHCILCLLHSFVTVFLCSRGASLVRCIHAICCICCGCILCASTYVCRAKMHVPRMHTDVCRCVWMRMDAQERAPMRANTHKCTCCRKRSNASGCS